MIICFIMLKRAFIKNFFWKFIVCNLYKHVYIEKTNKIDINKYVLHLLRRKKIKNPRKVMSHEVHTKPKCKKSVLPMLIQKSFFIFFFFFFFMAKSTKMHKHPFKYNLSSTRKNNSGQFKNKISLIKYVGLKKCMYVCMYVCMHESGVWPNYLKLLCI